MPYAAKAIIQHSYEGTTLSIWITFACPMNQTVMPALTKWICTVDDVVEDVTASVWQDEYTLLLTVPDIAALPDEVTLEYEGPGPITYLPDDPDRLTLETTWGKQWQPWGAIESYTGWPTTFKYGMIILWHGAIVDIPSGWHLCDGTEGTPDLRDKFIVGAGNTYPPDTVGGYLSHTHSGFTSSKTTVLPAGADIAAGSDFSKTSTTHNHYTGGNPASNCPPFYALCYIMKL